MATKKPTPEEAQRKFDAQMKKATFSDPYITDVEKKSSGKAAAKKAPAKKKT